jgi:LAS superfamily LD-carboxypeptidase LdcB
MKNQKAAGYGRRETKRPKILIVMLLIVVVGLVFFLMQKEASAPGPTEHNVSETAQKTVEKPESGSFKVFTGKEFAELYDSFVYPNTQKISENSPITGNRMADERIKRLAADRGYRLHSAPVANTFVEVEKNMLLQQRAAKPWTDMKAKALASGSELSLTAAYRSAQDQRAIFLDRLSGISFLAVARGKVDSLVNKILEKTALPGYSRHHTGYTIDIACDNDPNARFVNSGCFRWLSKDNYLNAKTFGWIPSYPEGIENQGPEPESWEYVWVGTDVLK